MLQVYNCIVTAHDLRLVLLAACVCALASYSAISLLQHSANAPQRIRPLWLLVAAVSTGCGIWATHFIGMLAFSPGIANGYDGGLTYASLAIAIVVTGAGFSVATLTKLKARRWIGGAVVGVGIASMHYTGMAAFQVAGTIAWDTTLVAASIWLGAAIAAAALPVGLSGTNNRRSRLAAAGILTVAICSHHFTAMGAVAIFPDPTVDVPQSAIPATWLAMGVALGSLLIILFALTTVAIDLRERRRTEMEAGRMQRLANAAIEGIMICNGTSIVSANNSLAQLAGATVDDMIGTDVAAWLPDAAARDRLFAQPDMPIETEFWGAGSNGERSPVELILRPIDFGGQPHQAIAVRDLKARRAAEHHIRYLALHDALTSLPNRSSFTTQLDQRIEDASANGRRLAVLYLDLDRFKEVNDLYGHATGDKVLQTVASRVTASLKDGQVMARLGGDEFAVLIPDADEHRERHSDRHLHPGLDFGGLCRRRTRHDPGQRRHRALSRRC